MHASNLEWDRVWVGANIATMVAGGKPYGNLADAALAVKGERIAWTLGIRHRTYRAQKRQKDRQAQAPARHEHSRRQARFAPLL